MAIAEEDALIVDLVVGGLSRTESRENLRDRRVDAQRIDAVSRFLKLMDQMPATEPPGDLVESTLKRIHDVT